MPVSNKMEARKQRILKAALKIFADKGLHEATIGEVARQAGVSEGTIYEYFSSKEGLLFAIPMDMTRKAIEAAEQHVELIRGAANKLRAYVFLLLRLYQQHPEYAALNLRVLRHHPNFRDTELYDMLREAFQKVTLVIEQGARQGELRSDINPYIVRAMLMGAVDHVTTNWLLTGRKRNLVESTDPIMEACLVGVLARQDPPGQPHWSHWQSVQQG